MKPCEGVPKSSKTYKYVSLNVMLNKVLQFKFKKLDETYNIAHFCNTVFSDNITNSTTV